MQNGLKDTASFHGAIGSSISSVTWRSVSTEFCVCTCVQVVSAVLICWSGGKIGANSHPRLSCVGVCMCNDLLRDTCFV